jgi:endonuclease/exonuclease/phosphatase family metal-dependent hydrolase
VWLATFAVISVSCSWAQPKLLTWDELVTLYQRATPPPTLAAKLHALLTTPFVSNAATKAGKKPLKPSTSELGPFLRVVQWNIERGLEFDAVRLAFSDADKFVGLMKNKGGKADADKLARIREEIAILKDSDLIILNEVDWGLNRTRFRNVAKELAEALGMNYAWGLEFVEVDPLTMGIDQHLVIQEVAETYRDHATEKQEVLDYIHDIMRPDPERYKGLHGSAILSRYPLSNVRLVPFRFQGHDWYADEKKGRGPLAQGQAKASMEAFKEQFVRQVRRGGRMMLIADITGPMIPSGTATVVATHLEDQTQPRNRRRQMEELLGQVREIHHPIIVAGDMNTSDQDATPVTVGRLFRRHFGNAKWWASEGVKNGVSYTTPFGWLYQAIVGTTGFARKLEDPTGRSIPIIAQNSEANFFEVVERFRFDDGTTFDFRGDRSRTANGHGGRLADSNERGLKGFEPTEELNRHYGPVGKYKLDWFFVKPAGLERPDDPEGPLRFAPHFARTLQTLNNALPERISDHNPIVVDLPLGEPGPGASSPH